MSKVASTDRKAARRLDTFRRFLTHVNERILPDLGFVLWDGTTVPADLSADALAFVIADEGAVAAMIRRPSIDTFLNLWVTSRFSATDRFLISWRAGRRPAPGH
jgi:cyclopropane-fatty-acyl-phospholipid synthase